MDNLEFSNLIDKGKDPKGIFLQYLGYCQTIFKDRDSRTINGFKYINIRSSK